MIFSRFPSLNRIVATHPGSRPGKGWGYTIAVLATLATLGLRLGLGEAFPNRPLLILFMLPILLAAYAGGLGPGLLATALSAIAADFLFLPPEHSLRIQHGFDRVQLAFLVANGILVSLLMEALRRTRREAARMAEELKVAAEQDRTALKALEESEGSRKRLDALYRSLMETTGAGCLITDGGGRIILVNDAYCRRSGYTREELLTMGDEELSDEEGAGEAQARRGMIRGTGQDRYESRHRAKDGTLWPVEVNVSYSPMDGGRFFIFVQDIAQRLSSLEAVRSMEQFNRAILDSISAHVVVLDPLGVILAVNAPWREFAEANGAQPGIVPSGTGVGANYLEVCGKAAHEGAPGAREAYDGILDVLGGRSKGFTTEYPCHSRQKKRWFSMNVTPLGSSRDGVVITHVDISARRLTEEALVESERRFQDLARASSDWLWEIDHERRLTYVSESMVPVLGYQPEELAGRDMLELFPPEDRGGMEIRFHGLFQEAAPFKNLPATLLRKDGTRRQTLSTGTPILDGAGALQGFRGLDRDVTDLKAAEEEHRRLELELVQIQKLESIGRLAGGVAHDFNNMLGVILCQAEVAMMMPGSKAFLPYLTEISKAAQRSGELTRQLLAFARKQTVVPKTLDLNETIQGMLKMLGRLIGEDISLAWVRKEGLWKIRMDPSQIDQILANLTVNARDAIQGVGQVTLRLDNAVVGPDLLREHASAVEGEFVELSLTDSGCGMEPEILQHIFEPFFTTKAVGKGTGLGLATVFGIVKQNDGFILVDSAPGKGTQFRIFLPRHLPSEAEAPAEVRPEPIPTGQGQTILLVEDEAAVLEATRILLEQLGYRVLPARGPEEALVFAGSHKGTLDLLLTDVVMPRMNGRELSERVQALRPELPVLYMSGYTADILAPHGILEGGTHFVQKPASILDLAKSVSAILGRQPLV